jgi:hypothetical protein
MEHIATQAKLVQWIALLCAVISCVANAAESDVPLPLQGALIKKILAYDQTLEGRETKVLVLHSDDTSDDAANVVKAFRAVGLTATSSKASAASSSIDKGTVIYALGGGVAAATKDLSVKYELLSITGTVTSVEAGQIAVGLGARADGKPEVVINAAALKSQGHRLAAALQTLARIVQ